MADPEFLGKYQIRGALGKGAMGIVYKGYDPSIDRYVALKTIRKDLVEPEVVKQYMDRFRNEARAAGRLRVICSIRPLQSSAYALRRRRSSGSTATPSRPSDAGSGTASVIVRLSKMSALNNWLFVAELPVRPES